jgi:hypothetical protein
MVVGVAEGYTQANLELIGVGYKAEAIGQALELNLGHSHLMMVVLPKEISVATETKEGLQSPHYTQSDRQAVDRSLRSQDSFAQGSRTLQGQGYPVRRRGSAPQSR